jgi:hypothetical protein
MQDTAPKEQKEISKSEHDPNYRKKLEFSYIKCLNELQEPGDNWHESIMETKFTVDPTTGQPKTSHTFVLEQSDDLDIPTNDVVHSYIFKRSHFYNSFNKKRSRLKRDLIECWKARGYFVKLAKDEDSGKWKLMLSWRNN